jgi:hypothetical protein
LAPNEGLACLYQDCSTLLDGAIDFLSHTAHGHSLCL